MNIFTDGIELRKLRKDIGLSQSKLSEITGLVQAKISAYELGKNGLFDSEKSKIEQAISGLDKNSLKKLKIKRYQKHVRNGNTLANRTRRSYSGTNRNYEYLSLLKALESNFAKPLPFSAPNALSFFAGCGGLCYGIRAAGFKIVGASEIHEGFRKIYSLNFPDTIQLANNVRQFSEKECESILKRSGSITLMIGGPPCQGFSLTGKRDPRDTRNTLFSDYLRIAKSIMPQVILMENVKLLTSMKDPDGHLVTERILSEFSKIGYDADLFCVNAKCYGAPQHRERVIFIATNKKIKKKPSIPMPEFAEQADLFGLTKPFFTFGDAVSDLEFIESGEKSNKDKLHETVSHPEHVIEWLVDVPEGSSAHDNEDPNLRPPSEIKSNVVYEKIRRRSELPRYHQ